MKRLVIWVAGLSVCIAGLPAPGLSQDSAPIPAVAVEQAGVVLPRNTPVFLTLNETLNTKSSRTKRGNTFTLSVARDVLLGRYVVIPRGSRATGTVVERTKKGGFGKSGKIEISLDYIEVGDRRIAIEGRHREEGEGNSSATVATFVFLSMLGSGLITGHSAEIRAGQEFPAWTKEEVPVQLLDGGAIEPVLAAGGLVARPRKDARPVVNTVSAAEEERFGNARIRCSTCR